MIRRAILASEFWPGATARGLAPGLREAGWLVEEIDERLYLGARGDLLGRLEQRLSRPARQRALSTAILAAARRHRPEIFLTVKGTHITADVLARLRDLGVLTVNYYPDYHFNDTPIDQVARYDIVVTTKSFQLDALRSRMCADRAFFVPHGYSAEVHRPVADGPKDQPVDLLYVGNASACKAGLLAQAVAALPDLNIRIVGNGWRRFTHGTALERVEPAPAAHGDFFALEVARAKVNLAFHGGPDPATGWQDLVSTRTFEIPACGGFMLHIDSDEVRSLYDVPSEIDTFASVDELVDKVRYHLAHDEERRAIAARGHARAVPAYSYTERAKEIARIVEERLG